MQDARKEQYTSLVLHAMRVSCNTGFPGAIDACDHDAHARRSLSIVPAVRGKGTEVDRALPAANTPCKEHLCQV